MPRGGFRVTGGVGPLLQSWGGLGGAVSEGGQHLLALAAPVWRRSQTQTKGSGLSEQAQKAK